MSYRNYIIFFIACTLAAFGFWVYFVSVIDPFTAPTVTLFMFYLDLLVAFTGCATLIGIGLRSLFTKKQAVKDFRVSLRQGVLLGILLDFFMLMQGSRLFNWWNGLLLLLALVFLEFFFQSRSYSYHHVEQPQENS